MGGIIVKEALATAWREHSAYRMIWTCTYAIFFFAVPHSGTPYASWGQMLANISTTAALQPSSSLLESLNRLSDNGGDLLGSRFEPLHEAYKFYSWVESLPYGRLGVVGFLF